MKHIQKLGYGLVGSALAIGVLASGIPAAFAQQTTSSGTANGSTPVFYNQSGTATNPGGTAVPPGYYYNQQGQQVYYYGNGTYYNPSTGQYGGVAYNGSSAPGVPSSSATAVGNGNGTVYTSSTYGNTNSTTVAGSAATGGTPVFYQNGTAVNPGGTALPAGHYNLQNGQQVYYYGNGTYYDPSTGTYGGQVFTSPTVLAVAGTSTMSPGVPNTGAGGDATYTILGVIASLIIAGTGMIYLARNKTVTM